jgi:SAM-dependent methyltransferase
MPYLEQRMTELETGHFADGKTFSNAQLHLHDERWRQQRFQTYFEIARRFAPAGKWLDIGCGTGTLIMLAHKSGVDAEGIELNPDRRALARQLTRAPIYEQPLEQLAFPQESFAVVTLINVFSHLISPAETLSYIHQILAPGGIVLLHTGEIGPGVRKHHAFSWDLGDHLYYLGKNTIDWYAKQHSFRLIYRDTAWQPATVYTRDRFKIKGRSKLRNFIKLSILYIPGVFPLLRWYMLSLRQAGNPVYTSTLVLQKE